MKLHSTQTDNPLLHPFDTPHGVYPFDDIILKHFLPAFDNALTEKRAEVDAVIRNPAPATFENTVAALEYCGTSLEQISGIFFNLLHSNSNDELIAISEEIIPRLSELGNYIVLSEALCQRVLTVWENRSSEQLDSEDARLLWRCYEGFRDSGALLPEKEKEELRKISNELSSLTLAFGQNILRDENRYRLHLTDPNEVDGMPRSVLEQAAHYAHSEGFTVGWLFDLKAPSYGPFLQHCRVRRLREEIYRAKMSVGAAENEFDNKANIIRIANARRRVAELLGYTSFADSVLKDRMAGNVTNVYDLLDKLLCSYKPAALGELKQIENYAFENGFSGKQLEAWDWSFYAEQYKQTYYRLNDEELRPYFELSSVIRAVFDLATRLYNITFCENKTIPVYHPDVKAFEVFDENGTFLAVLYTDFFPRKGKQSGAWMNNFQDQYKEIDGQDHRPHIVLVMNFTPPVGEKPSLLRPGEVGTFLHEFGHALHGMLSRCRYASLSGTAVVRDFVELPSQIMENWLMEREWLDTFARHYQTGEALPCDLLERFLAARNYLVAYACCRQLSFGYLDLAYHSITENLSLDTSVKDFEERAWSKASVLPPAPASAIMSTSFSHIFSGGYAAGYYGYKWSEVLDADAFARFRKEGIFNQKVADDFRRCILECGDTAEPMDLYRSFRGQEPSIEALKQRDGITE